MRHTHNAYTIFARRNITFIDDSGAVRNQSEIIVLKISRSSIRLAGTSGTETETGTDNIPSRTRKETEGFYEMIFAITKELKDMNKRHNVDRKEFRTFKKEYEIDRKSEE